ncbi:hypothetical protein EI94DRAFT_1700861 [Lactarius quietus]|nr:hypothetical protein EI94DRAFT_1700861 [Lactarius quietus]
MPPDPGPKLSHHAVPGLCAGPNPRRASAVSGEGRVADMNIVIGVVVKENHVEELELQESTPWPVSRAKAYVPTPWPGLEVQRDIGEAKHKSCSGGKEVWGQQLMDSNTSPTIVMVW